MSDARGSDVSLTCSTEMLNAKHRFWATSHVSAFRVITASLRFTLMSLISKSYWPDLLGIWMCFHFLL